MNKNTRNKRLAENSILFAIGNFGSKMISFFMLPLYTLKLSQSDYGIVDLVITTTSLLLPVISLSVFDSVLRFALESESDRESVFTNSMFVTLVGSMTLLLIVPILQYFDISYAVYIVLILILQAFQTLFAQYSKSIDMIRIFAVNGMVVSFLTAGFNVLFLVIFELGINGYLVSIILANTISNIYLWKSLSLHRVINISKITPIEIKRLLKYSFPLIPNGIAWWANNTINRYFILFYVGAAGNGIFAVANKIPSLLNIINTIFFQAWQLSVIEEYDKKDSSNYYSMVFNTYSKVLFIGISILLLLLKPLMSILVSDEFYKSWKYVPFLLVTVIYSSYSSFYGNYYAASKKTSGAFSTTIYAALINIICNFILIPLLGLYGAGISSMVSFFSLWIIRHITTQKLVVTNINTKDMLINHFFMIVQITALYLTVGVNLYIIQVICVVCILFINRKILESIIQLLVKRA